jgi:hypothetical protein
VGESNGAGIAFRFDRAAEQLLPLSDHNVGWLRAGPHVAYLKESCDGRTCLWRTDGTSEGTRQIASHPSPHYVVDRYVTVGDTLVYSDYTEAGQQAVWGYRPDAETSEVLRLVDAPVACAHPSFGGEICYADVDGFVADELHGTVDFSADGDELRTDGTPAETMARTSYPFRVATPFFTVHEGALFGTDSAEGAFAGLWWIDGPSDAPRELGTLPDRPYNFVNAAGRVYFSTGLSENTQIDLHRVDVPCGDPALVGTALTACRVGLAREALSCGGRGSFQRNLERKLRRAESVLDHAATAESPKSARLEKRGKRLLDRIAHQIAGKRGVRKLGAECAATVGAQVRALTS